MSLRTCFLCGKEYDGTTCSKLCLSCRVYTTNCGFCGQEFSRRITPSSLGRCGLPQFCSPVCRNKARQLEKVPCPICKTPFKPYVATTDGTRRQYCSVECATLAQMGISTFKYTLAQIGQTIAERYSAEGPDSLAEELSLSRETVQQTAYKLGVKLNPDVYYSHVHEAAREYMLSNNPMSRPGVRRQRRIFWQTHPEKMALLRRRHLQVLRQIQRDKPSGLERKLWKILDSLGIDYETQAIIKPKFVVDVKIDDLIIQADGDYWHGHPRLEPFTERQIKQQRRDAAQDKYLAICGYSVARIWESDMSTEAVKQILKEHGKL